MQLTGGVGPNAVGCAGRRPRLTSSARCRLYVVFASTPVPVPQTALTGERWAATYLKES